MCALKCLVRRIIAVGVVAAVAVTLLSSVAAADDHKKAGAVCGYSEDVDGTKYLMKYVVRDAGTSNERLVCANTDEALPSQPSSPRTIKQIFGNAPSHLGTIKAHNWCIDRMFNNGHQIPHTGTYNAGTSTNHVNIFMRSGSSYVQYREDDPAVDVDDLVAGVIFCSLRLF